MTVRYDTIYLRRGLDANLPTTANNGEPLWTTDTHRMFVGCGNGIKEIAGAEDLGYVTPEMFDGLEEAIIAIGTIIETTIVIASPAVLTSALVEIPGNICIEIKIGGVITVPAGTTLNIKKPIIAGIYQCFTGDGIVNLKNPVIYPEWWGAVGDGLFNGGTPDAISMQKAIDCALNNSAEVHLTRKYHIEETLHINHTTPGKTNIHLRGVGGTFLSNPIPPTLYFFGTGAMIEIGTVSANEETAADYSGILGLRITNLAASCRTLMGKVDLLNGTLDGSEPPVPKQYLPGSYGILAHRGGTITIVDCAFSYFNYAFYGAQSAFNVFNSVKFSWNHVGVHVGYRSDQCTFNDCIGSGNDIDVEVDGAWSTTFNHFTTNGSGSTTTSPFELFSKNTNRGVISCVFNDCWFENYDIGDGAASTIVPSFISCGERDMFTGSLVRGVHVNRPTILTNINAGQRTHALLGIDQSNYHEIISPCGRGDTDYCNIEYMVASSSDLYPVVYLQKGGHSIPITKLCEDSNTATQLKYTNIRDGYSNDGNDNVFYSIDPLTDQVTIGEVTTDKGVTVRYFRDTNTRTAAALIDIFKADATSTIQHRIDAKGNIIVGYNQTGNYDTGHLQIGPYHFWVDSYGVLRIKSTAPASNTDGSIVGFVPPTTGGGAPNFTPAYLGQSFYDTSAKKKYEAFGTTSSSDWIALN